jgi:hypothetical protein
MKLRHPAPPLKLNMSAEVAWFISLGDLPLIGLAGQPDLNSMH